MKKSEHAGNPDSKSESAPIWADLEGHMGERSPKKFSL